MSKLDEKKKKALDAALGVCPKCDGTGYFYSELDERMEECPDCDTAATVSGEPMAWRHEILEPGGGEPHVVFSPSGDNPWSHWVESHKAECVYTRTPLYAHPAPTRAEVLEEAARHVDVLTDEAETARLEAVRNEPESATYLLWERQAYNTAAAAIRALGEKP